MCVDYESVINSFIVCYVQAEDMKRIYVPFCRDKSASEDLLSSHRSYLTVSNSFRTFSNTFIAIYEYTQKIL